MELNQLNWILQCLDEYFSYYFRRFLRLAMVIFSIFISPYTTYFNVTTVRKHLPPIKNPLLRINAIKLAEMIRTKKVSCEAVITAYIDRCKEVNPYLNAIVQDRFDDALIEAKLVDQAIANNVYTKSFMELEKPLLGLPLTVKESIAVSGLSHQSGRLLKKKHLATVDAPCVSLARKRGAIILLVSNTPELCMCWETYNKVTGITNNPYDLKRTPGGSSGGEAALISSGASLIGLSSDIAGSARLPAAFTGIFGHKPTPYFVSPDGHIPKADVPNWGNYFTIAPMTRYATDLTFLLNSICDSTYTKQFSFNQQLPVSDINVFYMTNDGPSGATQEISKDIERAIEDVAKYLNGTQIIIDDLKWSVELSMSVLLQIKNVETIYYNKDGTNPITIGNETLKYLFGTSDSTFPSVMVGHLQAITKSFPQYLHRKMLRIAENLKNEFLTKLGNNGVFLYPTFPNTAHKHFEIFHKLVDPGYMMIFNTLGLPVTNCMVRMDGNNLPIGIQVVTNPGNDHLSLTVAKAIEAQFGGWIEPT